MTSKTLPTLLWFEIKIENRPCVNRSCSFMFRWNGLDYCRIYALNCSLHIVKWFIYLFILSVWSEHFENKLIFSHIELIVSILIFGVYALSRHFHSTQKFEVLGWGANNILLFMCNILRLATMCIVMWTL